MFNTETTFSEPPKDTGHRAGHLNLNGEAKTIFPSENILNEISLDSLLPTLQHDIRALVTLAATNAQRWELKNKRRY